MTERVKEQRENIDKKMKKYSWREKPKNISDIEVTECTFEPNQQ